MSVLSSPSSGRARSPSFSASWHAVQRTATSVRCMHAEQMMAPQLSHGSSVRARSFEQ